VLRYAHPFNFSDINNFAANEATGEILCFLNNDTEVLSADWLNRARAFLSLDDVGAVGARLIYPDHTLQHFGVATGLGPHGVGVHLHLGIDEDDPGYFNKAAVLQEFSVVTAACLFMRASTFREIGGFEPELPVDYNDVDLCLKVRAQGLRVLGDPGLLLIHKESKTRGMDSSDARRAKLDDAAEWLLQKWSRSHLANDPYFSPNHSLDSAYFALATPPRVLPPWRRNVV
jgi:GT2 family glycosyltransferase